MKCLNPECSQDAPTGYQTCSQECNAKAYQPVQKLEPKPKAPEDTIGGKELSEILGVHYVTVMQWAHRGKIPSIKVSPKMVRFRLEEVRRALQDQSERAIREEVKTQVISDSKKSEPVALDTDSKKSESVISAEDSHSYFESKSSFQKIHDEILSLIENIYAEALLEASEEAENAQDLSLALSLLKAKTKNEKYFLEMRRVR